MRIYFERWTGRPTMPDYSGDPIYRDWPVVPSVGDHLSFDIGDENPVEGNVRAIHWSDPTDTSDRAFPDVKVVFS